MKWIASQYNMKLPPEYTDPTHCSDAIGRGDILDIDQENCVAQLMSPISKEDLKWMPCAQKLQPDPPTNCGANDCKPNCTDVTDFHRNCLNKDISGCYETVRVKVSKTTCDFSTHFLDPDDATHREPWSECSNNGKEGFNENIFQCRNSDGELAICSNNCRGVNPNAIIIGGAAVTIAATVSQTLLLSPAAIGAFGLGAGAVGIGAASGFFPSQCPNRTPCQVRHQL